jgi:hypothetical protein
MFGLSLPPVVCRRADGLFTFYALLEYRNRLRKVELIFTFTFLVDMLEIEIG